MSALLQVCRARVDGERRKGLPFLGSLMSMLPPVCMAFHSESALTDAVISGVSTLEAKTPYEGETAPSS